MDGIELEIFWSNLISIVSEQAKALQRIAFSPIVREAGDLAAALFDAVQTGSVKVTIGQRWPLADVRRAHEALEMRQTTGSTLLTP